MKFPKKFLQNLAYGNHNSLVVKVIETEIYGRTRWSVMYSMIFKVIATGKYYSTYYSKGATEMQDESPYEYLGDEIECAEVVPKKVKIIAYVEVEEENSTD